MLAGTPIDGGHYFVDLIGGIAVTVMALAIARMASRTIEKRLDATEIAMTESSDLANVPDAPSVALAEPPRHDRLPVLERAERAA
jgi:hypothetical protein